MTNVMPRNIRSIWFAVLLALWLFGQAASALHFHEWSNKADTGAAKTHSCLLCNMAHLNDVIVTSPLALSFLFFPFVWLVSTTIAVSRVHKQHFKARAPPSI